MTENTVGALVTLSTAVACSFANILQSQFTDIPPPYFMLIGGVCSLVVGPLFCLYLSHGDPMAMVKGLLAAPLAETLVATFSVTAGLVVLLALRISGLFYTACARETKQFYPYFLLSM